MKIIEIKFNITEIIKFPGDSVVKDLPDNAGVVGLIPGSGRSPGERNGNPYQYSCPGESHGQRSLVSYSPWGQKRVEHDLDYIQGVIKLY